MRQIELVHELLIRRRFFQRMKVDPVQVLYDGLLEGESVVHVVLEKDRNEFKFGNRCRSPAAFAGDELILVGLTFNRTNNERLKYA